MYREGTLPSLLFSQRRVDLSFSRASGLGLATVKGLVQSKAYVSILDRLRPSWLDEHDAESSEALARVLYIKVDVTDVEALEKAVDETVEWTKKTGAMLGGCVPCAAIGKAELVSLCFC